MSGPIRVVLEEDGTEIDKRRRSSRMRGHGLPAFGTESSLEQTGISVVGARVLQQPQPLPL